MQEMMFSINYVTHAPYFLQSMASSFIMAMFIGAVVHNGDLNSVRKTIVTLGTYVFMLFMVNYSRIVTALYATNQTDYKNVGMAYASSVTVVILTAFYILGLLFGVAVVKWVHRKKTI